jgi:hypothetical protein
VVVRDYGTGIRPRIRSRSESALGIGLAIIQALARRVEFNDPPGGGTEVRMEFAARPCGHLPHDAGLRRAPAAPDPEVEELASTTIVAIAPSPLASSVLPRGLALLAARARFTTDRISDLQLIADALAAHARGADGGDELRLTARVSPRRIELTVGPLAADAARELLARDGGDREPSLIGKLSNEQRIDGTPKARESTLVLAVADERRSTVS